jgi:hypothetical protein
MSQVRILPPRPNIADIAQLAERRASNPLTSVRLRLSAPATVNELRISGPGCDPGRRWVRLPRSPQDLPVAKPDEGTWLRTRRCGGSSPSGQANSVLGLVAEQQALNLLTGVRLSQAGLITLPSPVRIRLSRPIKFTAVAQWIRARPCGGRGQRFESSQPCQFKLGARLTARHETLTLEIVVQVHRADPLQASRPKVGLRIPNPPMGVRVAPGLPPRFRCCGRMVRRETANLVYPGSIPGSISNTCRVTQSGESARLIHGWMQV